MKNSYVLLGLLFQVLDFSLFAQISAHPNPFMEKTVISYTITEIDTISISVSDITGKTVAIFLSETQMNPGSHDDTLYMEGHPDGIYYLVLENSKKKDVLKMVKSGNVSIDEWKEPGMATLYPNPSARNENVFLQIEPGQQKEVSLFVTDLQGRIIIEPTASSAHLISIDCLDAGTYLLWVIHGPRSESFRLLRY
jgi:hypothetical protein